MSSWWGLALAAAAGYTLGGRWAPAWLRPRRTAPTAIAPASSMGLLETLEEDADLELPGLVRLCLRRICDREPVRLAEFIEDGDGPYRRRDPFGDLFPLSEPVRQRLAALCRVCPQGEQRVLTREEALVRDPSLEPLLVEHRADWIGLAGLPLGGPQPGWLIVLSDIRPTALQVQYAALVSLELALAMKGLASRRELEQARRRVEEAESRLLVHRFETDRERQTLLRELEQARLKSEEARKIKNEFLSSVSHELRTPLNAIQGYTRIVLRDDNLNERQRMSLERVMTSSKNQLKLINNILDYSRLEAGRMRLDLEALDMAAVCREVAVQVEPLAAEQQLELQVEMPEEGLHSITDRAKVERIVINLLGNAIKFTKRGGVRLRLEGRGGTLRLSVEDTGIGIGEEEKELIFERFRRGKQTDASSKTYSGTGLGLAISRRLTELLGGRIEVESELGRGSTFTVLLPHFLDLATARQALQSDDEDARPAEEE
jgi:signal transduction histidine kinase